MIEITKAHMIQVLAEDSDKVLVSRLVTYANKAQAIAEAEAAARVNPDSIQAEQSEFITAQQPTCTALERGEPATNAAFGR